MSDPPLRYADISEYTVEQHVQRLQALKRGEPEPRFEREEYRIARRQALEAAGLADDTPPDELTDPESMTVDDILATRKANR